MSLSLFAALAVATSPAPPPGQAAQPAPGIVHVKELKKAQFPAAAMPSAQVQAATTDGGTAPAAAAPAGKRRPTAKSLASPKAAK